MLLESAQGRARLRRVSLAGNTAVGSTIMHGVTASILPLGAATDAPPLSKGVWLDRLAQVLAAPGLALHTLDLSDAALPANAVDMDLMCIGCCFPPGALFSILGCQSMEKSRKFSTAIFYSAFFNCVQIGVLLLNITRITRNAS